MSASQAIAARTHPLRSVLRAVANHPFESFLLTIIDAAFFVAVLGVNALVNTLALALGVPSITTALIPVLLFLTYAILLVLIITIAKELHLRIARRLFKMGGHELGVMRLFSFSAIATAALLGAYLALGKIFSGLAGSPGWQAFVFALFVVVILLGVLVVYPGQWYLSEGMNVPRAYRRGIATLRRPLAHARVVAFILIGEIIIFILYSVAVVIFRSSFSGSPAQFGDAYASFIRASSAGLLILSYFVFSFARLLLYEHTIALRASSAPVREPEAPVHHTPAHTPMHQVRTSRSRRKDA